MEFKLISLRTYSIVLIFYKKLENPRRGGDLNPYGAKAPLGFSETGLLFILLLDTSEFFISRAQPLEPCSGTPAFINNIGFELKELGIVA